MKLVKTLVVGLAAAVVSVGAFADVSTAPANQANAGMKQSDMEKCAQALAKAMRQDAKQDAKGQNEIHKFWVRLYPDAATRPPEPQYEGSSRDMNQDAKLEAKLLAFFQKHNCPPPASPIL